MCSSCCTEFELKKVVTKDKRVDIIDKKLNNFHNEFRDELSQIKKLMADFSARPASVECVPSSVTSTSDQESSTQNPWHYSDKVKNLFSKKVLVVRLVYYTPIDYSQITK